MVLVSGCHYQGIAVVNATQPDMTDSTRDVPRGQRERLTKLRREHLVARPSIRASTAARRPVSVPVLTCLTGIGYSSVFRFSVRTASIVK